VVDLDLVAWHAGIHNESDRTGLHCRRKDTSLQFMVEVQLAAAPTQEILELVPSETARGRELDAQGVRLHFFRAADQSKGWQVFEIASREELDDVLASFPLHPYLTEKVMRLSDPDEAMG
jgi:muconolactone delta-isomerase